MPSPRGNSSGSYYQWLTNKARHIRMNACKQTVVCFCEGLNRSQGRTREILMFVSRLKCRWQAKQNVGV